MALTQARRSLHQQCQPHLVRGIHRAPQQRTSTARSRNTLAKASHETGQLQQQEQQQQQQHQLQQQQSTVTGGARLVGTPIYTVLEVGELLVVLMLLDAAWSGDWSRIGVITKDTEAVLQTISYIPLIGHLGTAVAAGVVASRKGRSPVLPAVKGFLFGALGLYEEQHTS